MKDSAIVAAKDLPKVMRLEKCGFKLTVNNMKDGRFHVVCESKSDDAAD